MIAHSSLTHATLQNFSKYRVQTNAVHNGLLMVRVWHQLFDHHHMGIHPEVRAGSPLSSPYCLLIHEFWKQTLTISLDCYARARPEWSQYEGKRLKNADAIFDDWKNLYSAPAYPRKQQFNLRWAEFKSATEKHEQKRKSGYKYYCVNCNGYWQREVDFNAHPETKKWGKKHRDFEDTKDFDLLTHADEESNADEDSDTESNDVNSNDSGSDGAADNDVAVLNTTSMLPAS